MKDLIRIVSLNLDEQTCVISDVGDGLFGAIGIRTSKLAEFIAPAYYLSMGFAVPACIGVAAANPKFRPIALVGDGAFQMTGMELSTAVRLKQKPIIIVLNNNGYGTMRKIRDGKFNVISQWNYGQICQLIGGGKAITAKTKGDLQMALQSAIEGNDLTVIDAQIDPNDMSPQLQRMTTELARRRGVKR